MGWWQEKDENYKDLENNCKMYHHCVSLFVFVWFVNSLSHKERDIPSFLGTLREYGTATTSYTLMWFLRGVNFPCPSFQSCLWGLGIPSLCNVIVMSQLGCWLIKRSSQEVSIKLCNGYCVYMLHVWLLMGFVTKRHLIITCCCSKKLGQRALILGNPHN
jgi:hypothetical protein